MTDQLAALLRLTPFAARGAPDPRAICTDCLSAEIGHELSGLAWGLAEDGDSPGRAPVTERFSRS